MIIRSFSRQYRLKSNRKKRRAKRAHACKTGNPILSFALVDTIHGFLVSGFTLQKGNRIVPKTSLKGIDGPGRKSLGWHLLR
jgi:hypothetical protein